MTIQVLFFASLKEHLGKAEVQLEVPPSQTVAALWQTLSMGVDAVPEQILVAVNQEYVHADYQLKNGDEVAFFPPVTGG
jgi:molybdopterin synthase sulfur carrier subunit